MTTNELIEALFAADPGGNEEVIILAYAASGSGIRNVHPSTKDDGVVIEAR